MAACLSPAIRRQPSHHRCCWTPKLPSSSTATYYRRPHRRITGTSSTAISAHASAAAVAQGLDADDIRHPLDKQPRRKITESLTIEVRLPNNQIVTGWIEDPQIYVHFFIVKIKNLDGELKTTSGVDLASVFAHTDEEMLSTCRIHEVGIGGPLVDFDGNFVGMNCSGTKQRKTPYVRRPSIRKFMWYRGMVSVKEEVDDDVRARIKSRFGDLKEGGGHYINRLDAIFKNDILRKPFKGVGLEMDRSAYSLASESSKRLASEMNRSVVSLASFNDRVHEEDWSSCVGL